MKGLQSAAAEGGCAPCSGLGATTEAKILKALEAGAADEAPRRSLLGSGLPIVRAIVDELRAHPAAVDVAEAGSVRRRRESFRDLDVIATATDPAALIEHFVAVAAAADVVARGDTKATVVTQQGFRLDLRVVPPECFGNLLQHFTGSKEHNVALREAAVRRGFSVSEYGVTVVETGGDTRVSHRGGGLAFLGYAFIPPELRENTGELEAARTDTLPALVELAISRASSTATPRGPPTARRRSSRWPSRPGIAATPTWP